MEGHPDVWGIVLAAGSGSRFGAKKQFMRAKGQRLVDMAVEAAKAVCHEVVLVLPAGEPWDGPEVTCLVEGGSTRSDSVRRALAVLPADAAITVVHQAAHPLASIKLFQAVIGRVRQGAPAAVPGMRSSDVITRVADGYIVEHVGRDDLVILQTPGAFRTEVLRAAHAASLDAIEDTALVAALGERIAVIPGEPGNLHITTREDLALAERLVDCSAA
jgi:2-C-methyl-D-erythritol 4-phosphate cytidylyltransferase